MKQKLKIYFTDMWGHGEYQFNPMDNYFYDLFSLEYDVVIDPNPDILIFSCFGNDNQRFNCKKIYFCGENQGNNFKHPESVTSDVTLSHFGEDIEFNPKKHLYFPLWALFVNWYYKDQPRPLPSNPTYHVNLNDLDYPDHRYIKKTKFCCFINNNPIDDRIDIFNRLSKYKKVDSYGYLHNNMGKSLRGSELDKINLLKEYKFTIAFENSFHDGYNTEKIIQPLSVQCIPLYKGGQKYKKYLNPRYILDFTDYSKWDTLIEEIISLDSDDNLYDERFYQYNKRNSPVLEYDEVSPIKLTRIGDDFEDSINELKPKKVLNWIKNKLKL